MRAHVISTADKDALRRLLWAPHQPEQDIQRWLQQGFVFQPPTAAFPLGLVQGHGGPCGVLAAVQAELMRVYLFPTRSGGSAEMSTHDRQARLAKPVDVETQHQWLVRAMASLLFQCESQPSSSSGGRSVSIRVVVPSESESSTTTAATGSSSSNPLEADYEEYTVDVSCATDELLLQVLHERLPLFQSPLGVVLFVFSVLRTKTVSAVRDEMDDLDGTLTGNFGHCGQELLNLLLTGIASSNVFDGSVPMGDTGLLLRGIEKRPHLGYLTQLEALRYCQVGNYYKSPQCPVWVIGSSSHFSVCFGLKMELCEASTSLMLFQRVQRVFKSFDPMEAGFLEIGSLAESLQQLGVAPEILSNDFYMAQLCARLEVSGAGIVLWDEYWKIVSVLLHTSDLELALSGSYGSQTTSISRPKSDEELAQELQAQFDAEERGGRAAAAPQPPVVVTSSGQDANQSRLELHYYNGLFRRPHNNNSATTSEVNSYPPLTKFSCMVNRDRGFIGQSIPIELSTSSGSGGNTGHPLEEILKTKWPSATFTWATGQSVPKVD